MAKRRQTTGLPRAKENVSKEVERSTNPLIARTPLGREYASRAEREEAVQRFIIIAIVAAVAITVLVIAVALFVEEIITPARTIASVNGSEISVGDFEDRVRFARALNIESISAAINLAMDTGATFEDSANFTISQEPYASQWNEISSAPDQIGLRVLNDMIDEKLVRSEAETRGITVSEEDIQAEIDRLFTFDRETIELLNSEETPEPTAEPTFTPTPFVSPTPSPEPSATLTPEISATPSNTPFPTVPPPPTLTASEQLETYQEGLNTFYNFARREAGFSESEVNEYFEYLALRLALAREVLEVSDTETWVNSRHILVETEATARDIIEALQNGESFADLAAANGTDGTASRGGELGWAAISNYVGEFGDAVRDAPIGIVLEEPVITEFGFHVVQVNAREERETEEALVEANLLTEFDTWLSDLRASGTYNIETNSIWPDFVPTEPQWRFVER